MCKDIFAVLPYGHSGADAAKISIQPCVEYEHADEDARIQIGVSRAWVSLDFP